MDSMTDLRSHVILLYVLRNHDLKTVVEEMKRKEPAFDMTIGGWKSQLGAWGIYKNISGSDAHHIQRTLKVMGCDFDQCLVISGGILVDLHEVMRHLKRKKTAPIKTNTTPRAPHFIFIPLAFKFSRLSDLDYFKGFQRLLWYTSVHFNSCFDMEIWSKDENGIYNRSPHLRLGLSNLSLLHNKLWAALKDWRRGQQDRWWVGVRAAFELHESVVRTNHHRQFPDLLAIALLYERHGRMDVRTMMTKDLFDWAQYALPRNDPRINMFQELHQLPWDATGHLFLAFDAYCRDLWQSRTAKDDEFKANFGYNQASFPRAERGRFYSLYERKTSSEIRTILASVDQNFNSAFESARICLWHSAIRYHLYERRYDEAEILSSTLGSYLKQLQDWKEQKQPNLDTALTFSLLGAARVSLGRHSEALTNFEECLEIRGFMVPDGVWDACIVGALEKARGLATQLNIPTTVERCATRLDAIYVGMEERDKTSLRS
ncbi:hypothetical protein GQ44DRAFT_824226 [Phaeosphaeriaceae sp. PMI808]|nr:hypothetical protein GQ44DRAFT_824226 [Phaeosphaeriaceae sp. PMI808]